MLKKILNFIRIIISIYLVLYIIITAYFTINKQIHNISNANIWGYSYMKVSDEYNKNDIPKDRYIILQTSLEYNVGDYVIINENGNQKLKKITKINNFEYTTNYSNIDEETIVTNSSIIAKVIYNNATFSNLFGFFTNIITVIILFVIVVMIPNFTYKRYS